MRDDEDVLSVQKPWLHACMAENCVAPSEPGLTYCAACVKKLNLHGNVMRVVVDAPADRIVRGTFDKAPAITKAQNYTSPIHARDDYNGRIVDLAGKIPDDEPVFLLRAQDISAPATIRQWAYLNLANGGDPKLSKLAEAHADKMMEWQKTHKAKPADL